MSLRVNRFLSRKPKNTYCSARMSTDPRLQQALLNYADNAIKFTTAGRIAFFVHVVEENSKTILLRFEVEDTGAGIPKDSIPRLFNRFEQAEPSTTREHGGTGLGLEITKRIAEQMGGRVGVESAVGSGSSFWFSAKLKKKHKEQTASSGHPTVANNEVDLSVDTFRGCRVLVVEDDDVSRTVLQKMLRELGFKPDGASDGEEALRKAARHRYDLILMDIQMPKMNGVQTTERLRTMKNTLTTPIVALSGDVAVNTRDQCHDAGMNGFLLKPLDPNNFIQVLKKAMVDRL